MLKPINGNIIVRDYNDDALTKAFVTTTEGDSKFSKGTVISSDSENIKVGAVVLFAKFAVDKVEDMFIVHNTDIFAIDE